MSPSWELCISELRGQSTPSSARGGSCSARIGRIESQHALPAHTLPRTSPLFGCESLQRVTTVRYTITIREDDRIRRIVFQFLVAAIMVTVAQIDGDGATQDQRRPKEEDGLEKHETGATSHGTFVMADVCRVRCLAFLDLMRTASSLFDPGSLFGSFRHGGRDHRLLFTAHP